MTTRRFPMRPPRPFVVATPTDAFELINGWPIVTDDQIISEEPIVERPTCVDLDDEHTRPTWPNTEVAR